MLIMQTLFVNEYLNAKQLIANQYRQQNHVRISQSYGLEVAAMVCVCAPLFLYRRTTFDEEIMNEDLYLNKGKSHSLQASSKRVLLLAWGWSGTINESFLVRYILFRYYCMCKKRPPTGRAFVEYLVFEYSHPCSFSSINLYPIHHLIQVKSKTNALLYRVM